MKTGCIYRIINTENDKCYVGQTIRHIDIRMSCHFNQTSCRYLARAIAKYGKDAFKVEILENNIPQHYLGDREIYWIRHFNTVSPNGYNLTHGGDGCDPSDETRRKLAEIRKGKRHSAETRQKISEAKKGKAHSVETREKMSESHKGQTPWNKGKVCSAETKKKISEANRNPSPETRRKMSEAKRNLSTETRRKMSDAKKGKPRKPHSIETRRKISMSRRKAVTSPQ